LTISLTSKLGHTSAGVAHQRDPGIFRQARLDVSRDEVDMAKINVAASQTTPRVPRTIWMLGFVSLLMDTSSELIHALLPIFLVTTLGASTFTVGTIEGIAEATTSITKIFSGVISDWIGKRKPLVVLGYGLAALTKPLFPLASTVGLVVTARVMDRLGKGIRGAPRDALVADITAPELRGAAFGLRQSLDTIAGARAVAGDCPYVLVRR
jgi:MFS family permease